MTASSQLHLDCWHSIAYQRDRQDLPGMLAEDIIFHSPYVLQTMTATSRTTRLFTLRLWQEEAGAGQVEWRGKVQALPAGEAYYFRDWPGLVGRLEAMLDAGHADTTKSEPPEGDEA
jgi:hypothetical protein